LTLEAWFHEHPEAAEAVRLWLVARQKEKTTEGSRAMVARLQREHAYPFNDHTVLQRWARERFPSLYASSVATAATPRDAKAERAEKSRPAQHFKRSTRDVKALERRQDFFVTCAVQEARANRDFLGAIQAWCGERDATLVINPVNYVNPRTRGEAERTRADKWWDPALAEYMLENELRPHPELSIMTTKAQATAHNPLPGRLSGRTQARSAVFGHPQLSMRTVATPQSKLPKILYSSGAITDKNYSETLAGDMADFHHSLGGVIVEVRGNRFHLREVTWDGKGFTDLDRRYTAKGGEDAPPPEALVMGDIHAPHFVSPTVMAATFGQGGIVETLRPRRLVLHDLADNRNTNPHELMNRLTRAALVAGKHGEGSLARELEGVAEWLCALPGFEEVLVVRSNHDDFIGRWLERQQPEPQNAKLFHQLCYLMLDHHERTGRFPIPLELALRELRPNLLPESVRFLDHDESFRIGGVELGMHGHNGPDGARGTIQNFSRIGTRSVIAHKHGPGIWQGAYQVGLSGIYRHGYNVGPSSWLQSHALVHENGYRQLVHMIKTYWRG